MAEARGRKPAMDVVMEDAPEEVKEDNRNEEFNQHVKNLVALYAQQILQELEQRIVDLETLSQQPQGAIQFQTFQNAPAVSSGEVPWYSGGNT